jgi:hypothetical protein
MNMQSLVRKSHRAYRVVSHVPFCGSLLVAPAPYPRPASSAYSPPAGGAGSGRRSGCPSSLWPLCILLRSGHHQPLTAIPAAGPRPAAGGWPACLTVAGWQQARPLMPQRRQKSPVFARRKRLDHMNPYAPPPEERYPITRTRRLLPRRTPLLALHVGYLQQGRRTLITGHLKDFKI